MVFRIMKSGGFQVKSTQNLIKSDVSTKTIQFDECRRGAIVSYTNNTLYSWYKYGVLVKPFIAVLMLYSVEVP